VIKLFLPIGVLLGGGAVLLGSDCRRERLQIGVRRPFPCLRMVGTGYAGFPALGGDLRDVVNPATVLATRPCAAISQLSTPPDARFLINARPGSALAAAPMAAGGCCRCIYADEHPASALRYGPPTTARDPTNPTGEFAFGQSSALPVDRPRPDHLSTLAQTPPITAAVFPSQGLNRCMFG
jgi:hypothetical protein